VTLGRILRRGDLVLIAFPFTDLTGQKRRPALIVGRVQSDDLLVAFITTQIVLAHPPAALLIGPNDPEFLQTGLKTSSIVRLDKLATLHRRLVSRRLNRATNRDRYWYLPSLCAGALTQFDLTAWSDLTGGDGR